MPHSSHVKLTHQQPESLCKMFAPHTPNELKSHSVKLVFLTHSTNYTARRQQVFRTMPSANNIITPGRGFHHPSEPQRME